ncbi:MAG: hypothetical protein P1U88_09260 [Thalassobaculaceae bacterium]|nr:hypothetical protein [Thalassobaculaceae bacterium]
MRRMLIVATLALLAAGCARTSVTTAEDVNKALVDNQGLVVLGLSKHRDYFGIGIIVGLSEVDPVSGQPKAVGRDATARVFFPETDGLLDGWNPTLDFVRVHRLPPGEYTLAGITLTARTPYGIRPNQFYDRVKRRKLPPYDPANPKATRPIFTVEAGKAVYIGHLMIDRTRLEPETAQSDTKSLLAKLNPFSGHGPRTEGTRSYRVMDREADARSEVAKLNIAPFLWTKELIWMNADERPGATSSGSAGRNQLTISPSDARPSSPANPALDRLPAAELQRRFLSGEISMEEYNKARAGQ